MIPPELFVSTKSNHQPRPSKAGPDYEGSPTRGLSSFLPSRQAIIVRLATQSDLPELIALQAANSNSLGFLTAFALSDYIGLHAVWIAQVISANGPQVYNEAWFPAGYIISARSRRYAPAQSLQPIMQCVVERTQRRKTIGTALVHAVEQDARARGVIGLQARVAARLPANHFWLNRGFVLIDHQTTGNRRRRALLTWRKPLTKKIPRWFADANHRHEPAPTRP